jgi:hypothetical protein
MKIARQWYRQMKRLKYTAYLRYLPDGMIVKITRRKHTEYEQLYKRLKKENRKAQRI